MAKPTLATIPAAFGTKLYSVLPSTGVGDFTFTRASSATRIAANGYIETVASGNSRLDYQLNPDGTVQECPHYLLEPARTNSVLYSQEVDNAWWLKSGCTITPNTSISPEGALNADTLTTTGVTGIVYKGGITAGSLSFFAKDINLGNNSYYYMSVDGVGFAKWDKNGLLVEVINGTASDGVNYGNGWFRFTWNVTSGSVVNYGVDGEVGESILVYGLQNEPSATYSSSYIQTTTTAVTRAAETANDSGDAATFNDSEGVLMAEISALIDLDVSRYITLSDGTPSNRIIFDLRPTQNVLRIVLVVTTSQYSYDITLNNITSNNKVAFKYKENDLALWVNGIEVNTSLSANVPTENTFEQLDFSSWDGAAPFYGKAKQVQYFDSALTDLQLETLTSWITFEAMVTAQLYTIY